MNSLGDIFRNCGDALSCAWQVLRYLGRFIWLLLQPKAVLAARSLALQSQLAVCKHRISAGKAPQPRFNQAFRILYKWVVFVTTPLTAGSRRLRSLERPIHSNVVRPRLQ
jgi:hypothetical protein